MAEDTNNNMKEQAKKMADLSRLSLSKEEEAVIPLEIEKILEYVGKVKDANIPDKKDVEYPIINVFREDFVVFESGKFTDSILKNSPKSKDGMIEVKKILG